LNALYEVVGSGTDVWVNKRRFRIQRRLGEGGFAFVYLVREQPGEQPWEEPKDPSHISGAISLFPTLFFCTLPNSSRERQAVREMSGDAQGIVNADEFDANEAPIMLQKLRALQFLSCCLLGPLLGLISLALVPLFHAKTTEQKDGEM
jgi:hypothetical protein